MKNLKLILSVLVLAMGAISFVNAQSSCSPVAPNLYSCEIGQQCPIGAVVCACPDPYGDISSGMCGDPCNPLGGVLYQCDDYQFCPIGGTCACDGTMDAYDACYPASNPSSCSYSGKTIFSGNSMQLYKTTTGLCEQQTIYCNSSWSVNLSNSTGNGYIYTGCTPSGGLPSSSCSLGSTYYTSGSNKTGYSVPSGSCTLNSIQCNNGLWINDIGLVQYDICSPTPSGGGGGGGGGSSTPTCTFVDLMCVSGTYQKKPGVNCISGDLGESCSTNNNGSGDNFDRIGDISNSPYDTELNLAYLYAYNMGITDMDTIQKADMVGNLVRSHMAKMLVNWSKEVLGLQANTGKNCSFDDIDILIGQDLYDYVIQACQMGLMGLDNYGNSNSSFDPSGLVTRAQFGTVLSRAIWGNIYNGGSPYYKDHLDALKSVDIMTKINEPYNLELRGWVMLMLMRTNQDIN